MSGVKSSQFQLVVIGLVAALMGVGQNGLLVSLPFLVEQSAFSLSTWSLLIAVGSFLFLPSAPFWGRVSDRHGPKNVVLQALAGMTVSFLLLCLFAMASSDGEWAMGWMLTGLVVARVIYGCTVAGMVPASQHWAILLCGKENRLQAITSVSIGLSVGRLIGPLVAVLALKLSPFAPLMLMILLPLIALLAAAWLPNPNSLDSDSRKRTSAPWLPEMVLMPFLVSGLLLCAVIALLQYSFSPLIGSVTQWSTSEISDAIGVLLTVSAAATFLSQVFVIKKKRLTAVSMYRLGSIALVIGFGLFLSGYFGVFVFASAVVSVGAALLVPAYTSMATEKMPDTPGVVSGYVSMSHTIGYGLASLLAFTATLSPHYPIYLCLGFSLAIGMVAFRPWSERLRLAKR
ncbi:permease [Vibrio sinaloensis]|uniref:MFS transporter n=1 Tax=Photobacterium sp. (strain ATCC 43367) TaxID=379097 RepID=UPI00057ED250|nr:MFS transporter [Vibrio sinaloensis]KIE22592.1 permease [Vibrio sinaloensis]